MKTSNVTFRLDPALLGTLDRLCQTTGRSRSNVVRDALRRQLPLDLLDGARRRLVPLAEARGIHTDEDVFALHQ
jgi:predicted transcriptional regulator